mgnify:CR=1 FL=1
MDENENSEDISRIRSFDPAAEALAPDSLRERIAAIRRPQHPCRCGVSAVGLPPSLRRRPWLWG